MSVPFLDVQAAYLDLRQEIDEAVSRVLASGTYILGPEVEHFEADFASYVQAEYCIGLANGLDALRLSLLALGVGPGHEVIVPSNTFIATWLAVSHCGATPVPVEPDPETGNIDPTRIEAAITQRTRVVMPVHLYGQPADLDPILTLARAYGLKVLEDAAQAHGALYNGRRIGAHGDAVAWSFYPTKNLGALGDGGAVTTNNPDIASRLRLLRNYGARSKYVNEVRGFNSRLDPVQAAILRVKLAHLDGWNDRRRRIAKRYQAALADCALRLPKVLERVKPVWHLYVVGSSDRDALHAAFAAADIQTLVHYPIPPYRQQAYGDIAWRANAFPITDSLADAVLSLPIGPHQTDEQTERVIEFSRSAMAKP